MNERNENQEAAAEAERREAEVGVQPAPLPQVPDPREAGRRGVEQKLHDSQEADELRAHHARDADAIRDVADMERGDAPDEAVADAKAEAEAEIQERADERAATAREVAGNPHARLLRPRSEIIHPENTL